MVIPDLDLKRLKVYKIAEKIKSELIANKISAKKLKHYVHELKQERKTFDFIKDTDNLYSKSLLNDIFKIYNITEKRYIEMTLALAKKTMKEPKVVKITPVDAVEEKQGIYIQYTFEVIVPKDFYEKSLHTVKEISALIKKDKAFVCGYTSKFVKEEELMASHKQIAESHYYSLPIMDTLKTRKFKKAVIEDIKAGKIVNDHKKYMQAYTKTIGIITELAYSKIAQLKSIKSETPLKCQKKKYSSEINDYLSLVK